MTQEAQTVKMDLIDKAAQAARRILKDGTLDAARFIQQYYQDVPPRDILDSAPANLAAAAAGHWAFGAVRRPGKTLVRAFNPNRKEHGWDCRHTVVEVVNDDMPFLVDSVSAEVNRRGLTVHLAIHPILRLVRDRAGHVAEWLAPERAAEGPGVTHDSFMHFQVTQQSGDRLGELAQGIEAVLADVRAAVEDWRPMREKLAALIAGLESVPVGVATEEAVEARDFLRWLHDNHFTFLGARETDFRRAAAKGRGPAPAQPGLGILRNPQRSVFSELRNLAALPPEVRAFVDRPELLLVTKTNQIATVHRPVRMDFIGVKRIDTQGKVVGQQGFVGLFTSTAYSRTPRDIPLLRRKLHRAMERSGFGANSHNAKALLNILETFPRDELFQTSEEALFRTGIGILNLQDRQRVALFLRRDEFERFISCLVFVPRDRYTMALRETIQEILRRAFDGISVEFATQLGDAPLARVHIVVRTTPGRIPRYDAAELERAVAEAARTWADRLGEAIDAAHREEKAAALLARYRDAFPAGYRDAYGGAEAVGDIARIEGVLASGEFGMHLHRPADAPGNRIGLKLYHPEVAIALSDVLPMLEHMGLKVLAEVPHAVHPRDAAMKTVMIHDFVLETRDGSHVDIDAASGNFYDTFGRVRRGEMESDGFNALVLTAGLKWREVVVLRAFCKCLRQLGIAFSQAYMEQTLCNNAGLARLMVALFLARFDPARRKAAEAESKRLHDELAHGLDAVVSADEDRILRRFINLIDAMLRTNYFQKGADGGAKPHFSFKLDSRAVEEMPLPKPLREIFVYGPRMEGLHLRFGKVARGGLRWSDRREDFRTEILGLVKAQQVKNAVIVPVGSKGGFVLKRAPAPSDREAFMKEGIACYKTLVAGLLDLTDNLKGDKVVPPPDVVRYDGDDPYLVVAADKGTATFSDIANGVSAEYGFWLGDAFASGGSQGYDHKKLGITARGAWECVKRHFRELGTDIQGEDFTCVGVGDMSGDVFGNAMMLSPHMKLLGAFNHLHIFVDPDPDPVKSLAERRRLFNLPRSSWSDYDPKILSQGARVYPRTAKTLALTPEIKNRFNLGQDAITPAELIRVLLKADVDLLWFGGIGTYVKASDESNAEAGDRSNDGLRINGKEIRARVVGEGANLGVTQRGRVEYALGGGRLNTDAIDNSAGVDCSDHEVNIKILVDSAVERGALGGRQRNQLLAKMANDVAQLCLKDNYRQGQALTIAQSLGVSNLDDQQRLIRMLERAGVLDRAVEFLPDDETLAERAQAKVGLTRPEMAVLLSYVKNWLYDQLLESDLPDDPHLVDDLNGYFPPVLQRRHADDIRRHRLRREIIATVATNALINRAGATFVTRFMETTGTAPPEIARAYVIASQVIGLEELWSEVDALDSKVPAVTQTAMLLDIVHLADWVTLWFLRKGKHPLDLGAHVREFRGGIHELAGCLDEVLPQHYVADRKVRARPYLEQGVPQPLALRVAGLVNLFSAPDIVRLSTRRRLKVPYVAELYFLIGTRFRLGRLRAAAEGLKSETHWQTLAVAALIEEIYAHQLVLANQVLDFSGAKPAPTAAIEAWVREHQPAVDQTEQLMADLWSTGIADISMVAVASRQLRALTEA